MKSEGTFRYIQNIAGWTARPEIHRVVDRVQPKNWRPKAVKYSIRYGEKWNGFQVCPNSNCDILFMIDSTGSMSSSIKAAHDKAERIAMNLKEAHRGIKFRFGSICYRDPVDSPGDIHEWSQLNNNIQNLVSFLGKINATGGGDGPEDYAGAFEIAINNIDWNSGAKNIFMIADAPAHSSYFCCSQNHEDQKDRLINDIKTIAKKGISICAIPILNDSSLLHCFNQMKSIYNSNCPSNTGNRFTIENFQTNGSIPIDQQIGSKIEEVTMKIIKESLN